MGFSPEAVESPVFRTFRLTTILGVPVRVHATVPPLLALGALIWPAGEGLAGVAATALFLTLLVLSVIAHELAHAFTALWNRVASTGITVFPLFPTSGIGPARLPPRTEVRTALSGPLTSLGLGALLWGLSRVWPGWILDWLALINLFALGLFNLLPGLPLDGGRILRSMLSARLGRPAATRHAARIGQVVALAVGGVGLFWPSLLLVFLAIGLAVAARFELLMVELEDPSRVFERLIRRLGGMPGGMPGEGPGSPDEGSTGAAREAAPGGEVEDGDAPEDPEADRIIELGPDGEVRRVYRRSEDPDDSQDDHGGRA